MGQRTNLLLQVEGRSGARLNRVYHLQWGYRKYLPMAFLHILSSRYFKPVNDNVKVYQHNMKGYTPSLIPIYSILPISIWGNSK